MHKIIKTMLVLLLLPCLIFTACTKNEVISVYKIEDDALKMKQFKVESLTPQQVLYYMQDTGVVSNEVTIKAFESKGDDSTRELVLDLSENFAPWLALQDAKIQKLVMQALANTFISNYHATKIAILSGGQGIKTSVYDFSHEFVYIEVDTSIENLPIGITPTAQVITPSPTPVPTPTNKVTPKPTARATKGPIVTPQREEGTKYVAITFDDGPHKKYTRLIVDKLNEYGAKATFFVVGNRIDSSTSDAVKYLVEQGNEIAIHGYTHSVYYNKCSDATFDYELSETAKVIKQTTGVTPTLMRPIGGNITNARVQSCGYPVVMWNVDSEDWKHKTQTQSEIDIIVNNVMKDVGDGKIILMHEIYENSYQALDIILRKLTEQGYKVVTVTELFGENNLVPGYKYFSAK